MFFDYPMIYNRRCKICNRYWFDISDHQLDKQIVVCDDCFDIAKNDFQIKKMKFLKKMGVKC